MTDAKRRESAGDGHRDHGAASAAEAVTVVPESEPSSVSRVASSAELAGGCGFRRSLYPEGKIFAGIQRAAGIQGIVDAAHQGKICVGEKQRHEFALFHADAVLAGEAAADFDAVTDDFGGGFQGAFELSGVARIVKHDAGEDCRRRRERCCRSAKVVLLANFLDAAKRLRKFRAWNHAVKNVVAGSDAAQRAEGILAAFPEKIALVVVAGDAYFAGVVRPANFFDGGGLRDDGFRMPSISIRITAALSSGKPACT